MLRLLIIDDESLERVAIRTIVESSDLAVEVVGEAANGVQALEKVVDCRPNVVFVDIKMPCIGGLEFIRRLNETDSAAKIVIISAYDEFDYVQEALGLGVSEYLLKPVHRDDIIRVLNKTLAVIQNEEEKLLEEQRLKERLERMMPYIKSAFLTDLLYGNDSKGILVERAKFLGFAPVPSALMLVDIDKFGLMTETMSEGERQLVKQAVFQAVEKSMANANPLLILPQYVDKIIVLLGVDGKMQEERLKAYTIALAEDIRVCVSGQTGYTCTVCVGRQCDEVSEIVNSFDDVRKGIMLGKIYVGGNRVIHVDEIKEFTDVYNWYPFEGEKHFVKQLTIGDHENYEEALSQLLVLLYEQINLPKNKMRMRLFELNLILSRATIEAGIDVETVELVEEKAQRALFCADTSAEMIQIIEATANGYRGYLNDFFSSGGSEAVNKAILFLNDNYQNEITLKDVAKVIPLNAHYFSRLFKKEMGMNFIDYLTKLRLENAKKMLLQTDLSVAEISDIVGYHDANYFSRVFSKSIGIPPSEYRQNCRL